MRTFALDSDSDIARPFRRAERLSHILSVPAVALTVLMVGSGQANESNPISAFLIAKIGLEAWALLTPILIALGFSALRLLRQVEGDGWLSSGIRKSSYVFALAFPLQRGLDSAANIVSLALVGGYGNPGGLGPAGAFGPIEWGTLPETVGMVIVLSTLLALRNEPRIIVNIRAVVALVPINRTKARRGLGVSLALLLAIQGAAVGVTPSDNTHESLSGSASFKASTSLVSSNPIPSGMENHGITDLSTASNGELIWSGLNLADNSFYTAETSKDGELDEIVDTGPSYRSTASRESSNYVYYEPSYLGPLYLRNASTGSTLFSIAEANPRGAGISKDGSKVIYGTNNDLYIRDETGSTVCSDIDNQGYTGSIGHDSVDGNFYALRFTNGEGDLRSVYELDGSNCSILNSWGNFENGNTANTTSKTLVDDGDRTVVVSDGNKIGIIDLTDDSLTTWSPPIDSISGISLARETNAITMISNTGEISVTSYNGTQLSNLTVSSPNNNRGITVDETTSNLQITTKNEPDGTIEVYDVGVASAAYSGDSLGKSQFREEIRYTDETGLLSDPTLLIYEYTGNDLSAAAGPHSDPASWDLQTSTGFNHNQKAFEELEDGQHYAFTVASDVRQGQGTLLPYGTVYTAVGIEAMDDDVPISLVVAGRVGGDFTPTPTSSVTATGTPTPTPSPTPTTNVTVCSNETANVSVVQTADGLSVRYCGETVKDFKFNVSGPNGTTYQGDIEFPEPTGYYQGDLSDSVTSNLSTVDPEDVTVDYSGNYSDVAENQSAAFNGTVSAADFLQSSGGLFGGSSGGGGPTGGSGSSTASTVGGVAILAAGTYLGIRRFRPSLLSSVPVVGNRGERP